MRVRVVSARCQRADEGVVVRQTIVRDQQKHRSMMHAVGPLSHGVMQQIRRCDFDPVGFFLNIGGPDTAHLQCAPRSHTYRALLPMRVLMAVPFVNLNRMVYLQAQTLQCSQRQMTASGLHSGRRRLQTRRCATISSMALPVSSGAGGSQASNGRSGRRYRL